MMVMVPRYTDTLVWIWRTVSTAARLCSNWGITRTSLRRKVSPDASMK